MKNRTCECMMNIKTITFLLYGRSIGMVPVKLKKHRFSVLKHSSLPFLFLLTVYNSACKVHNKTQK